MPDPVLRQVRAIFTRLENQLHNARPAEPYRIEKAAQEAIRRLNRLNDRHPFIATIEREDLAEALVDVLHTGELPDPEEFIDRHRDW